MAYGLSNSHVTSWSSDLERSNLWPQHAYSTISKTARFRDSVPKDHRQEMTYGVSNSHVTDDVTWPQKVLWGSTVGYPSDSLATCSTLWHDIFNESHEMKHVMVVKAIGVKIARKVIKAWNFAQVFIRTYLTILRVEPLRFQCCLATVTRRSIFLSNQHQRCSFWSIVKYYDVCILTLSL